ncbi:chemotaxis protein CheW [Gorillibacterium sp. sgz5001074]|uniref:chemotaxis protein CheW n=1 Tax=Gorillibacterium sp. sgz5001074 TaxID=3446695 RepID=UPI003F67D9DB
MAQEEYQEHGGGEGDGQKDKYLSFCLGDEAYGMEIRYVTEIIGLQPITEVPELPDYIKGIMNLRGKIIPVMDVRLRFRKPFREYNDRTCVIVIDIGDISIGLIVDSVSEVLDIPSQDIVPPPDLHRNGNRFIKGIGKTGKEVKLLLDCGKLIHEDELDSLEGIVHS